MGIRERLIMHEHIIQQSLIGIGITQFSFGEGIVDETSYLSECKEVVGITTDTNESILSTPSKDWATFKAKYDELQTKFPMDELRVVRNVKLTETDWSQSGDIPDSTKTKWQTYRQALRDIGDAATTADVVWPTKP